MANTIISHNKANIINNDHATLTDQDHIKFSVLGEQQSFNSPEGTGVWYVSGVSSGAPTGTQWGMLFQMRSPYSWHPKTNDAVYSQIFCNVSGTTWARTFNNGAWSVWKVMAN